MNQIDTFGEFIHNLVEDYCEFLVLGFSPSSIPIQRRWKNNGLSANFVADYLVTFLPFDRSKKENYKIERKIKESVNYIANELLENAMKFNHMKSNLPIKFGVHTLEDNGLIIVLNVQNSIDACHYQKLRSFIDDILTIEPDDFYMQQLERSVEGDAAPGIGLISMKNDYAAKLGWKLETIQQDPFVAMATTMVQLEYKYSQG
ncbi:DUF6272 family protein [Spirulina subsalsa]|uniref:DUF6272 family protein n=1 Tax=Spirulina subsalsa TaxID=54311 RepID=UPI0002D3E6A7|nr:DUF6272 family protein [Spirulina subsalsa]